MATKSPAPLSFVQVGMGGWGRSWAEELQKYPELSHTVGYVDVEPEMLRLLRRDVGIPEPLCFGSLQDALAATEAEAVLVTTALPGHAPVAIEALEAGKHVLVEKPIAPTIADARRMIDAAQAAGRMLMVSQNYRFYPAAQTAARLVRDGELGPVGSVSLQFRKYGNTADPATNAHYRIAQPLLLDMAIHHFDLMRFVLDAEPVSVASVTSNPPWSRFVEPPTAVTTVRFPNDVTVAYEGSWVSSGRPTTWAGDWRVECEQGAIEWTGRDDLTTDSDRVLIRRLGKKPQEVKLPAMDRFDRAGSVREFRDAIREGRSPVTSGEANLGTLALTLAAIEASITGRPQDVAAMLDGDAA
ncbi:Gfo/Idh/MocA family protein [Lysobacter korlensis]|uniref:Gfo/Idh/MocA family protein n=1 Tax=Lysobacter korlensis TaxID=553636 RepID=A0ABV6RXF1_9GAMM